MKNAVKRIAFRTVQYTLWLPMIGVESLGWAAQLCGAFFRRTARLLVRPYYWAVVSRRHAADEPLWQQHDLLLGIHPPGTQDVSQFPQIQIPCHFCDEPIDFTSPGVEHVAAHRACAIKAKLGGQN